MQTSYLTSVPDLGPARHRPLPRESFRLHRGSPLSVADARPAAETSPLHSVQAFAATMFVMSAAACWIAVASVVTAPLIGAGELLTRAARSS